MAVAGVKQQRRYIPLTQSAEQSFQQRFQTLQAAAPGSRIRIQQRLQRIFPIHQALSLYLPGIEPLRQPLMLHSRMPR